MFASQLLRILQTIPSDVKYETCVYDSADQDMTMKENQNTTLYDSKSLGREGDDPLAFGSKEIYQCPSAFELKGRDECWNPKFVDDFSMDNQNGTRDSTGKEFQNGHLYRPSSPEEDADSLSSDTNAKDEVQSSPEHESSITVEEFTHCHENESRDSRSPYIAASDLFETDTTLYTDKNVLECDPPELIVCYKEINYHVVKDICVDEGMPVNGKILIESSKDEWSGRSFSQPLNDDSNSEATEGAVDMEFFISDGLATSSMDNTKCISANELGSKEESHGKLLAQERPKSPSESSFDRDTGKHCDPEESIQKGETNFGATGKTVTDASGEDSFIDRTLPIQEFGTRSFLRSFLNSLDGDVNKFTQLPDQISSGKAVCEGPAASSAEAGPKEDVQASSLYYNSNVESGSITFNFNSLAPVVAGDTNGGTKNIKEQSVDSRDMLNDKDADADADADADNLSDARQGHCSSSKDTSIGKVHEESLNIEDGFSNDFSATSQAQFASSNSVNSINSDSQAVRSRVLTHERRTLVMVQLSAKENMMRGSRASLHLVLSLTRGQ
ncbi:hypothetical protein Pfo_009596 [Paulownia fortunei]|nr:hypothetical protein Pfo_009596 [Paulownia fortunei]